MELAQGRYRLIRRLGEGGTGVVYGAADSLLGRTVAIKALHPSFDATLLRREGQALARMNHPGVVALYDLIEQDDRPYLVMEYVDGCDLGQWLTEHDALDLDAALTLFARIASIVSDAHLNGLVHCDLKPSNVLLSRAGEIKLSDFTLARLMGNGQVASSLGGSDGYAAPEALDGGEADARTDIFSLGALLRRLTSGAGDSHPQAATIRAMANRALSTDRAERFATVEAMLAALPLPMSDVTRVVGRSVASDVTRILPRRRTSAGLRRGRLMGPVATVFAVLTIAGGAVFVRLPVAASPARVTLPNLVTTQTRSAKLVALSLQLQYRVQYAYSSTVPIGVVVEQRPAPGAQIDKHGIVTVTVSKGPAPVAIPDLSGSAIDAATIELQRLGFHVIRQMHDALGSPAGLVLDQIPSPHTLMVPGAAITLTVSQKPWWDILGW